MLITNRLIHMEMFTSMAATSILGITGPRRTIISIAGITMPPTTKNQNNGAYSPIISNSRRNSIEVETDVLSALIIKYRKNVKTFAWQAIREIIIDRLEGSRRSIKGHEKESIVPTSNEIKRTKATLPLIPNSVNNNPEISINISANFFFPLYTPHLATITPTKTSKNRRGGTGWTINSGKPSGGRLL